MAAPTTFPEQNWELKKPENMTDEECASLPCFVDGQQVVSCWKLSPEELAEVARTGVVWLGVLGSSTPPAWLTGTNPFIQPGQPNEVLGSTQA